MCQMKWEIICASNSEGHFDIYAGNFRREKSFPKPVEIAIRWNCIPGLFQSTTIDNY